MKWEAEDDLSPPLVQGGQGRSREEVEDTAKFGCAIFFLVACLIAAAVVAAGLAIR